MSKFVFTDEATLTRVDRLPANGNAKLGGDASPKWVRQVVEAFEATGWEACEVEGFAIDDDRVGAALRQYMRRHGKDHPGVRHVQRSGRWFLVRGGQTMSKENDS